MTQTQGEMLQTIIERAVEGGWEGLEMWSKEFVVNCDDTDNLINRIWIEYKDGDGQMFMLRDILFNHDFAKALGYKLQELGKAMDEGKDPIEYLYEKLH